MKQIKAKFINQWTQGNEPAPCSIVYHYLSENYDLVIDNDNPDYVITQGFSNEPLGKYNDKVVIFETGEAIVPDFNLVDYAIGYDPIKFVDRYFQFPYHLFQWSEVVKPSNKMVPFDDRKFCNFIYSAKGAHPLRDKFFSFLSSYKKVDSYGRHLNNMQMPPTRNHENWQEIKRILQAEYKFTIAFENATHDGYTTEKICDAFQAGTIPIYFGNPNVNKIFNEDTFIWVKSESDFESALSQIKQLEASQLLFNKMVSQPKLAFELKQKNNSVENFLKSIFDQNLIDARRKAYGSWQDAYATSNTDLFDKTNGVVFCGWFIFREHSFLGKVLNVISTIIKKKFKKLSNTKNFKND